MPELPEVETVVRTLEKSLLGEKIHKVNLNYPKLLETESDDSLESLVNDRFVNFTRRGKYLCLGLESGRWLIIHLRMEGKFHLYSQETEITKHTHCVFVTDHHHVHYLDTRKFSRMAVVHNPRLYFENKHLGLEPWDESFTNHYLYNALQKRKKSIKATLLDQEIVVGIGNIYADEILFSTKIHPLTASNKITKKEAKALVDCIRSTLEQAILAGGTTVRSYTSSLNVNGRFQIALNAYGQFGNPCKRCGTPLDKIKVAGRTSVFCHQCQRVKL